MENLTYSEDINRAWKNAKENVQISANKTLGLCERKKQKPRFDEKCSHFLGQRKQAKMQWLQNPNQNNLDNLNNARQEASRHF